MKHLIQTSILFLGFMVVFAGCDSAQEAVDQVQESGDGLMDGVKDMANIDFGDFDMKGMKDKFAGITDGFKDVSADNVDGLTSKISEFSSSIDGMGIGNLTGPAKTAVSGLIAKFVDTIKNSMGGITDEDILSKLKPVVDSLMEKLNAFK